MKAVITAGGFGTRLSRVAGDTPKAMMDIAGKPVLARQLECLHSAGYTDVLLTVGTHSGAIRAHFGDGSAFGVNLRYYEESEPLGTAGALTALKDELTDDFLLINGDLVFDIDFDRFAAFHRAKNALASVFAHPNDHPFDSEILITDADARVTAWRGRKDDKRGAGNLVNAGIHILSPRVLEQYDGVRRLNLDRDILAPLVGNGLYAYRSPEYVKDMGTPARYREVNEDTAAGRVVARRLSRPQKAVFLDRDGTINIYKGLITNAEAIELIDGAADAIRTINRSGYLAVVITNQPVIARGDCTPEDLEDIHRRLEELLGEHGAYLDAVYFCPHHPDSGFPGENTAYKIPCDCRKPKPGMILRAAAEYHIDTSASWMVGDDIKDVLAGTAAGCKTAFLLCGKPPEGPVDAPTYGDLAAFVRENI